MCGISAIASHQPVANKLYKCLQNLEYRGYDSCGMALVDASDNTLKIRKNTGNVNEVNLIERFSEMQGNIGIAHTRWATHGGVTAGNSHPHFSNDQNFVIVHNGIFSNYRAIHEDLITKGYQFLSETDTEVFANLIQDEYKTTTDLELAFHNALKKLEGSFAIALMSTYDPDTVFAAKKDSPLVVGIDDGTNYLSSDTNAFIAETRDTITLDDYEYVLMTKDQLKIKRLDNQKEVQRQIIQVKWDKQTVQRGEFSHYMLKEIFDQPLSIKTAFQVSEEEIQKTAQKFIDKQQSYCVGVGTTYYVAMVGTYLFSQFAGLYVPAISSDEFPALIPVNENNHILFFSQSGETYDTRMAIRAAQKKNAETSAVVNVVGSSISQMVNDCIFQGSGPEICVVSTKAAVSQIMILWQIVLRVGQLNGHLTKEEENRYLSRLIVLSDIIEKIINEESGFIRKLTEDTKHIKNWLFMGRGIYYPIAMESALKMKEVTYIHAEGLPAGFLKHGTLAIIDESLYSMFFLPYNDGSELYKTTLMAMEEVKTRNGKIVAFCIEEDQEIQSLSDYCFIIPKTHPELTPLIELIIAQLFSYYSAWHLGLSIDKPRNLAKSVTVG